MWEMYLRLKFFFMRNVLLIGAGRSSSYLIQYLLCLLYTSDAADERSSVDLGGRRIIKKKKYNKK